MKVSVYLFPRWYFYLALYNYLNGICSLIHLATGWSGELRWQIEESSWTKACQRITDNIVLSLRSSQSNAVSTFSTITVACFKLPPHTSLHNYTITLFKNFKITYLHKWFQKFIITYFHDFVVTSLHDYIIK